MKFNIALIFAVAFCNACFCQTADTIRIYDHLKLTDRWKLAVTDNEFTLYTNKLFSEDDIITTGSCKNTRTTIQFICDTSKLDNKSLARDSRRRFSNIPFILTGDIFARRNDFFIPRNINYERSSDIVMPEGIFARYYRGDGFGSHIIELKSDNTYTFGDYSCTVWLAEKGRWTLNNDIITFIPDEEEWSMLEWVTEDRRLYLAEDYLVGKKTTTDRTKNKGMVVTENYLYLSKMPVFTDD